MKWTALGMTAAVIGVHLATPSYVNANRWPWETSWQQRKDFAAAVVEDRLHSSFARRPIVLGLVRATQALGVPAWVALVGWQSLFLWWAGVALDRAGRA